MTLEEDRAAAACGASSSQTLRPTGDLTIESMCRPLDFAQPQRPSSHTARAAHAIRLGNSSVPQRQDCSVPFTAVIRVNDDCGHLLMSTQRTPHKWKQLENETTKEKKRCWGAAPTIRTTRVRLTLTDAPVVSIAAVLLEAHHKATVRKSTLHHRISLSCRYLRAVRLMTADMPPWEVPSCSSSSSSTIVTSRKSRNAPSSMARV